MCRHEDIIDSPEETGLGAVYIYIYIYIYDFSYSKCLLSAEINSSPGGGGFTTQHLSM
jgi:hypothetical protein